ncbi:MAG: hypothetical protein DMD26_09800 [Gemmatimonadetes bacterium]|nr:MAG: hypothetical protein DMD26_09800 [Gemmatimonadota bacterium]
MSTADSVRVFVNAAAVDVPPGSSVLDAVRRWSEDEAVAVARGDRVITDSRGLPVTADFRVSAGSIFRLAPSRKRAAADGDVDSAGAADDP